MKRCLKCNMPDEDGTLYIRHQTVEGYALWCGRCCRDALDAAEAIVRDLAECVRPAEADYGTCLLCDQNPCAPSCPYRRAIEATKP